MSRNLAELEALARAGDWFALLGVKAGYEVDLRLLKERYLVLARATHPDFFAGDPEQLPRAERVSAALNRAMSVLEDPVRRAEYLLARHRAGVDRQAVGVDNKAGGAEVLQRAMSVREAIAEAGGDDGKLGAIQRELLAERGALLARIRKWALQLPTEPGEVGTAEVVEGLRGALHEMSYLGKLVEAAGG